MNKFQWNCNSNILSKENACENVVCEKAAILFRPQCVKSSVTTIRVIIVRYREDRPRSERPRTRSAHTGPSPAHWDTTVYPKKYAHGFVVLCFVVVMQSFIMNSREVFIHIHQGCFAGTGAIVRLPQCQWSKPDGYGKTSQCITTTKHSKAKTVCIFLGIYCSKASDILLVECSNVAFWLSLDFVIKSTCDFV